ncbi:hypothetical protein AM493_07585 [Flavobacterium akiainvivens]|uniref:LPXTG cell wall anchor domain-containing protein n=1 Tax=Flavobacterium akiainvivens TaxID=1202724 RepID=A0A0M9VHU2_9FLAO|nr:LPXTG cell wall anchor domain-containing protein [Flavobacterium akiainvivens]KOS05912.1 hypothetical protein AM493_07585 [Flavobacterium akiainvivens]SFQ55905.1 LPXTG-motif cell wall anchor domain-containing protein [Flavobacterium akiainvivens]
MKNNILKVFVLAALFVNVSTFAFAGPYGQTQGQGTQSTNLESQDFVAPINSSLYLLAGAGIILGAFFFNRKKAINA